MAFSLEQFHQDYDTDIFNVKIDDHKLQFLKPSSIERFINQDDMMDGFPMWAKIWEASAILMQYMAALPVDKNCSILELGSGLGVAGITAAILGHRITLTEYDQDALNFLKANVEVNHCPNARVRRLDWFNPAIEERFDLIIGSEIVYQESAVQALGTLFNKYLAPGGKVVLVEQVRSTGSVFYDKMAPQYDIRAKKHTLRLKEDTQTVVLFEMSAK